MKWSGAETNLNAILHGAQSFYETERILCTLVSQSIFSISATETLTQSSYLIYSNTSGLGHCYDRAPKISDLAKE